MRQLSAIGSSDAILCAARLKSSGKVDQVFNRKRIVPSDLKRGFIFGSGTSSMFVKSKVAGSLLFDESLPFNQDWEFMVRLAGDYKVAFMSEPMVLSNDGGHGRITNSTKALSTEQIENRMLAVKKHSDILGHFWVNYHGARRILAYLKHRDNRNRHFQYTVGDYGLLPLLVVHINRIEIKFNRIYAMNVHKV